MIETISLLPGVLLSCCRDSRFKQGCISIQLLRSMCAEEAAMNALLPSVLLRGTVRHPDMRSITLALDDLYGAAVSPLVRRVGDVQTTGLYCNFMDQRFALEGDEVLRPMVSFLRELLLDSPVENGGFLPEFVESEKKNLISSIEAELNDKQAYAMGKLLKLMCRNDSFGLPRLGEPEQVAAITPKGLYDHYRRILRESPVRIFYVGSAASGEIADLLRPVFAGLERQVVELPAQSDFVPSEGQDVTETMDVTQGKLCMGFVTPITNRCPEFAAMQVFNNLFGGGMTSKLFMNVREKQSLCYSIGSGYYSAKGIVSVNAGIDFDQEETARREILRQLEDCKQGNVTEDELTAAKEALISALRSIHDGPGGIENYYATAALSGLNLTPERYIAEVRAVTLEQVQNAARTVELNTTYFLKGGEAHD